MLVENLVLEDYISILFSNKSREPLNITIQHKKFNS